MWEKLKSILMALISIVEFEFYCLDSLYSTAIFATDFQYKEFNGKIQLLLNKCQNQI